MVVGVVRFGWRAARGGLSVVGAVVLLWGAWTYWRVWRERARAEAEQWPWERSH